MNNARRKAQKDAEARIFRILADNPEISQRALAQEVGISVGSVHYLLNALIEAGYVRFSTASSSKDGRRKGYYLTKRGMAEKIAATTAFLNRKTLEYKALKQEIDMLKVEQREQKALVLPLYD